MTALEVADWRRRVFALYWAVREARDLSAAHDLWRRTRDDLFARHPSTPLLPEDRADFTGLPTQPYDPAWRFEVTLEQASTSGSLEWTRAALLPECAAPARTPPVGSMGCTINVPEPRATVS